jgi:hypothetical protein
MGPNVKPFPVRPLERKYQGRVVLKVNNITTDPSLPAGSKILP